MFSNKWLIRAHDERAERELVASLGLRPLTARLLTARGLTEPAAVSSFIKKTDLRFYDPFLLTDMDKAVSRIEQAIRTGERICIYGDYDVDGVTSIMRLSFIFSPPISISLTGRDIFMSATGFCIWRRRCFRPGMQRRRERSAPGRRISCRDMRSGRRER